MISHFFNILLTSMSYSFMRIMSSILWVKLICAFPFRAVFNLVLWVLFIFLLINIVLALYQIFRSCLIWIFLFLQLLVKFNCKTAVSALGKQLFVHFLLCTVFSSMAVGPFRHFFLFLISFCNSFIWLVFIWYN